MEKQYLITFTKFKGLCRYYEGYYCEFKNNSYSWLRKLPKDLSNCEYVDICKKRNCPIFEQLQLVNEEEKR